MNGQAFLKYSVPKAPGRKSVEIYYPFDFTQQQMPNIPQLFPYDNSPQTVPQQDPIVPPYEARLPHAQDPLQPAQQEQPQRRGQVPMHP
ncbi:secretory calcium-binding phosphoprotein 5 [Osmerus eperlanus]|uniref:secretory calcium-binding phosphoprotein 5 n=1 Tax=Osmerus eperlanus TaxID=29151 RepID=UPI002E0F133C